MWAWVFFPEHHFLQHLFICISLKIFFIENYGFVEASISWDGYTLWFIRLPKKTMGKITTFSRVHRSTDPPIEPWALWIGTQASAGAVLHNLTSVILVGDRHAISG